MKTKSRPTNPAAPKKPRRDLKVLAAMLARLKSGSDLRRAKVRRVKSAVRDQSYVNLLKLEVAAQRLSDDLLN